MPPSRWIAIVIVLGAALILAPYASVIALAVWVGVFARRLHLPLTRGLGGRKHVAAWITVGALMLLAVPIGLLVTTIVLDAIELVQRVLSSEETRSRLSELVAGDDEQPRSASDLAGLVVSHSGRAWSLASRIAGHAAALVIGVFVFFTGVFAVLVDGERWYTWIERHAPAPPSTVRRLAGAFMETGRGLFIGIGGAGVLQAAVATVAYLVLGVPHALALGFLTLIASVLPAIGTALVWVPVAVGLAITGRTTEAIVLAVIGVAAIGTIDNLARPWLARRGHLQLPTFLVLVSMFGGIAVLGGWGLLMGPLLVRLAAEVLVIARQEREAAPLAGDVASAHPPRDAPTAS
jgi:predicted PurR-regulated permease PerM